MSASCGARGSLEPATGGNQKVAAHLPGIRVDGVHGSPQRRHRDPRVGILLGGDIKDEHPVRFRVKGADRGDVPGTRLLQYPSIVVGDEERAVIAERCGGGLAERVEA